MRIQPKVFISVIAGVVLLTGCRLEDPAKFGENCAGFSYIQEDNGVCRRDECSKGNDFFKADKCPAEQPFCIIIPNEEAFCAAECTARTHEVVRDTEQDIENDETFHFCEADTVEHCGQLRDNCTMLTGWVSGRCDEEQKCRAEKCADTYRLDFGVCKAYASCCGPYCAHCTDANNDSHECYRFNLSVKNLLR